MALFENVIHDLGKGSFRVGPETTEVRCYACGGEAMYNRCPTHGRSHWHGRIHLAGGKLVAACHEHAPK